MIHYLQTNDPAGGKRMSRAVEEICEEVSRMESAKDLNRLLVKSVTAHLRVMGLILDELKLISSTLREIEKHER